MSSWSVPINSLVDLYAGDMDAAVRDLALQGLRSLVLKTPVDTGRLRGGWLVSNGVPRGIVSIVEDKSGAQTISKGIGAIEAARAGRLVILENNVEYGVFVNDGSPTIRPHRMVERTVEELSGQ